MIETMGRNKAITINPTTTARKAIMTGSIKKVTPATALSRPHRNYRQSG